MKIPNWLYALCELCDSNDLVTDILFLVVLGNDYEDNKDLFWAGTVCLWISLGVCFVYKYACLTEPLTPHVDGCCQGHLGYCRRVPRPEPLNAVLEKEKAASGFSATLGCEPKLISCPCSIYEGVLQRCLRCEYKRRCFHNGYLDISDRFSFKLVRFMSRKTEESEDFDEFNTFCTPYFEGVRTSPPGGLGGWSYRGPHLGGRRPAPGYAFTPTNPIGARDASFNWSWWLSHSGPPTDPCFTHGQLYGRHLKPFYSFIQKNVSTTCGNWIGPSGKEQNSLQLRLQRLRRDPMTKADGESCSCGTLAPTVYTVLAFIWTCWLILSGPFQFFFVLFGKRSLGKALTIPFWNVLTILMMDDLEGTPYTKTRSIWHTSFRLVEDIPQLTITILYTARKLERGDSVSSFAYLSIGASFLVALIWLLTIVFKRLVACLIVVGGGCWECLCGSFWGCVKAQNELVNNSKYRTDWWRGNSVSPEDPKVIHV